MQYVKLFAVVLLALCLLQWVEAARIRREESGSAQDLLTQMQQGMNKYMEDIKNINMDDMTNKLKSFINQAEANLAELKTKMTSG